MRRPIIGIMGAGDGASERDLRNAEELGRLVAAEGWIVLTGGRPGGVMDAASRGAREAGGLVLGILPSERGGVSDHVDVAVFTGMGHARNVINVLTSTVVVACGITGAGTASEAALALKGRKPLILLAPGPEAETFFRNLDKSVLVARDPREAIELVRDALARSN